MNSTEQINKIFATSREIKYQKRWYKIRHSVFHQTMLMEMIDRTDIRKEKVMDSHSLLKVDSSAMKYDSKLFWFSKKIIKLKTRKDKL